MRMFSFKNTARTGTIIRFIHFEKECYILANGGRHEHWIGRAAALAARGAVLGHRPGILDATLQSWRGTLIHVQNFADSLGNLMRVQLRSIETT